MTFATNLRELRKAREWTPAGLADASGIPLGPIRDYEQGKRDLLFSNAQRLALALGISPDRLASDDPPPFPLAWSAGGKERRQQGI